VKNFPRGEGFYPPPNPPPWIHLYKFTIVGTCWKEALFGIGGTSKQMTSKGGVIIRMGASIGRMALNYSSSGLVSIPAPTPASPPLNTNRKSTLLLTILSHLSWQW